MAIASLEIVELRLLADPENAKCQKTHRIGEEVWNKLEQSVPQNLLGLNRSTRPQGLLNMNRLNHRNVKIEH